MPMTKEERREYIERMKWLIEAAESTSYCETSMRYSSLATAIGTLLLVDKTGSSDE